MESMKDKESEVNKSFESSVSFDEANAKQSEKDINIPVCLSMLNINSNCEMENDKKDEQKIKITKISKKKKEHKILMCVSNTKYAVVRHVGKKIFKYFLTKDETEDWDLCWQDGGVSPEFLNKMKPYQKVNHFPGMESISRKNNLGKNLMNMRKTFPLEYKFFPKTWVLPSDSNDLRIYEEKKKNVIFIVKPEASCQGRGIYLVKKTDDIRHKDHHIIQKYLLKPFLIDNLKFDMRIYVLVYGCNPIRIYLYKEGLARFCTDEYQKPSNDNLRNTYMHLTNYAINKNSEKFIFNEDANENTIGHKRSLTSIFETIQKMNYNVDKIKSDIEDAIIKTLLTIQPSLSHLYNSCQTNDFDGGCCFEILGFDFIFNYKLKPFLLEVNHAPSFSTDTPFDWEIKKDLIRDTIKLLHITRKKKINFLNIQKHEIMKRMLVDKVKNSFKTKLIKKEKRIQKRVEYEGKHLGGFKLIYPNPNNNLYEVFLNESKRKFNAFTNGLKNIKPAEKNSDLQKNVEIPLIQSMKSKPSSIQIKATQAKISQFSINNFLHPEMANSSKNQMKTKQVLFKNQLLFQPCTISTAFTPKPSESYNTKSNSSKLHSIGIENSLNQKKIGSDLSNIRHKLLELRAEISNKPLLQFEPLTITSLEVMKEKPVSKYEEIREKLRIQRNFSRCTSAKSEINELENNPPEKKKQNFL